MGKAEAATRPLSSQEREFVHLIVYQGLDKDDAYAQVEELKITDENCNSIHTKAKNRFYRPNVYNYYQALMEEVRDREMAKASWTKEVATEKLLKLVEYAEKDLYSETADGRPKQVTMGRLNAIVLPIKELNLMHGLNNTNVNLNGGCVVQFVGEEDIKD